MSVPGLAARRAAATLLAGVLTHGRPLGDQIDAANSPLTRLEPGERARAQALATATLRHLGRIDGVLAAFMTREPPPAALNALRLAASEMMLDAIPAHAAVDAAVRLTREGPGGARLAGLVNAVARRVADGGAALWETAAEADLPPWIAQPVDARFGPGTADAIAAASRIPAPLDLTPRHPADASRLTDTLGAVLLPTGSLRLAEPGQVSALPGFAAGEWWVQDAAAALPARLLAPAPGARVLDLCAAPGGKTLQLAAAGADVTALDTSAARLTRLRQNLDRTGLAARIITADATRWTPMGDAFDAILLDAPCSATGTLRRHPDLPYLNADSILPGLVRLQQTLLRRAWTWLTPGGRLVYCVCSILPAEGEEQLARFRKAVPEAEILPPDPSALGIEPGWIGPDGGLVLRPDLWPQRGGLDGFYIACLRKPVTARAAEG